MTDIRADIPQKYKWDLSAIYKSEAEFEADMKKAESMVADFGRHEADMISSPECLYETYADLYEVERLISKLYQYASRNFEDRKSVV